MSEKCQVCGNGKITHYRQIRKDGVSVVTARCENGHIPIKGQPFYPVAQFNLDELPLLSKREKDIETTQYPMFHYPEKIVREIWKNPEPIKKYPPMQRPASNGRNIPIQVEEE